jgi:hypothetical protein
MLNRCPAFRGIVSIERPAPARKHQGMWHASAELVLTASFFFTLGSIVSPLPGYLARAVGQLVATLAIISLILREGRQSIHASGPGRGCC